MSGRCHRNTHYIKDGKKLIFNSAFKEYKGEQAYFNFVKKKFIKPLKNQENFLFLGNINFDNSVLLEKLIIDILDRHYKKAQYDIKPLTFIIPDTKLECVKKSLIENQQLFNDGYEHIKFSDDLFFRDPIYWKKMKRNGKASDSLDKISFNLRIVSESNFHKIKKYKITPQMIYYFGSEPINNFKDISFLKIDGLDSKQINDIFNFQ